MATTIEVFNANVILQAFGAKLDKDKSLGSAVRRRRTDSGGIFSPSSVPTPMTTSAFLASIYKDLALSKAYGEKAVSHVSRFSASYVFAVAPPSMLASDKQATETLALWLSLVWIIDGVFDSKKSRTVTCQADEDALYDMLVLDKQSAGGAHVSRDPLIQSVVDGARVIHALYRARVVPYIERNPEAWAMQQTWFGRYLRSLIAARTFESEAEYRPYRLDTGAMMCVVAHLLLFTGTAPSHAAEWLNVAVVTSYHNDLFSLDRDMAEQTPNVVTVCAAETRLGLWEAFTWIDAAVVSMERAIDEGADVDNPQVCSLMRGVASGSRGWHQAEPRYAVGMKLLDAAATNDAEAFYAVLETQKKEKKTTAGDATA